MSQGNPLRVAGRQVIYVSMEMGAMVGERDVISATRMLFGFQQMLWEELSTHVHDCPLILLP